MHTDSYPAFLNTDYKSEGWWVSVASLLYIET